MTYSSNWEATHSWFQVDDLQNQGVIHVLVFGSARRILCGSNSETLRGHILLISLIFYLFISIFDNITLVKSQSSLGCVIKLILRRISVKAALTLGYQKLRACHTREHFSYSSSDTNFLLFSGHSPLQITIIHLREVHKTQLPHTPLLQKFSHAKSRTLLLLTKNQLAPVGKYLSSALWGLADN